MNKTKITSDNNNIYLHIEEINECCFELWEKVDKKSSLVKIKIPIKTWKRIIKEWKTNLNEKKVEFLITL